MLFNSIDFLFFFPLVVMIYFVIPKKLRYLWLLVASYYFYMCWNPKYALLMGTSTVITYASGYLLDRINQSDSPKKAKYRKLCVAGSLISNLSILAVFKYANFMLDNISAAMGALGFQTIEYRLDLLLPVGISFYTFQALSYTLDVYYGNIKAEKNLLRYALYVSFFPQLVAGPIERSENLLPQIQNVENINVWSFKNIRDGLLLMMWGLFQKLVIADRAAILVNQVYDNYTQYGMVELVVATVLFAFQIYCDFGGYSTIARGAAKVMGFELMLNFKQPYLAFNIKEFWRRWHISLTSWFTDYLYIPLGGNRKGELRKYINIFIIFAVSGLWHGASWNFIAWGVIHAIYQIIGNLRQSITVKITGKKEEKISFSKRIRKTLVNFVLVDFAWLFFCAGSFSVAIGIIKQMFTVASTTSLINLGLDTANWVILLVAIVILMVVDILHEKELSVMALVEKQEVWFRYALYLGIVWCTIMFGIYGIAYDTSQFIYFQF